MEKQECATEKPASFKKFEDAMKKIVKVSKEDMAKREAAANENKKVAKGTI